MFLSYNSDKIEKWDFFELSSKGPSEPKVNPFTDVWTKAVFKHDGRSVEIQGFYDGNGIYKWRFMPDIEGKWTFETRSNYSELDKIKGEFECVRNSENNHGPVRVVNKFHFAYADGTPYIPFGTTCYSWTYAGKELESMTLDTLKNSPFNKIRMLAALSKKVPPEMEEYAYPFVGSPDKGWDFDRLNPAFFKHLESLIKKLMDLGIEADLILFNHYGDNVFGRMEKKADELYLKYTIARLGAYRNVWWSVTNEHDLNKHKNMLDWDNLCRLVSENDPYFHMCSVHNSQVFYDCRKPWITHLSVQCQSYDKWNRTTNSIPEWREFYKKPVILDECGYEGNSPRFWGNVSPQEFLRRIWHGIVMGGYTGHGDTYSDETSPIKGSWTGQGGILRGQTPRRIAFLKKILLEAPVKGLDPQNIGWRIDCAGKEGEYYLAYMGFNQPSVLFLELPEDREFKIDIIDTWEMTIVPAPGTYKGKCQLKLPGKPYMAFQIYKI